MSTPTMSRRPVSRAKMPGPQPRSRTLSCGRNMRPMRASTSERPERNVSLSRAAGSERNHHARSASGTPSNCGTASHGSGGGADEVVAGRSCGFSAAALCSRLSGRRSASLGRLSPAPAFRSPNRFDCDELRRVGEPVGAGLSPRAREGEGEASGELPFKLALLPCCERGFNRPDADSSLVVGVPAGLLPLAAARGGRPEA